jgi:branched-subunit amino acid permease
MKTLVLRPTRTTGVDVVASVVVAVAIMVVAKENGDATTTTPPTIIAKEEVLDVVTPVVVGPMEAIPRSSAKCASSLGMLQIGAGTSLRKIMFLKRETHLRP